MNAAIAAAEQDNESLKKAIADLMPHDAADAQSAPEQQQ